MFRGDENAVPVNPKKSSVVTKACADYEAKTSQAAKVSKPERRNAKVDVERTSATSDGLALAPSTPCSPTRQPFKRIHTEETPSTTKDAKLAQSTKKRVKSMGDKRDSSPVRTCIRFKPQGAGERDSERSASIHENTVVMKDKKDSIQYSFDEVFGEHVTQEDMFERAARKLTDEFLEGYNATIFAYGQTGSGKTHTMLGDLDLRSAGRGITPRVFAYVFEELTQRQSDFELKVSFMQIYNEKCQDLLHPLVNTKIGHVEEDLKIRESAERVYVEGLSQVACKTAEQAVEWVAKGLRHRKIGKTAMNTESSRSHSILTLELTTKQHVSRLNLIDLAGSENQRTSAASSATQQNEANNINLSLTWLNQCLRDTVKGGAVVNYRNSKLTKILKDSLGGTAKTCVIATVSAFPAYALETASTLKFAFTIKSIQTHAVKNVAKGAGDDLEAEVARLRNQVEEGQAKLKAQAQQYEAKLQAASRATPHPSTLSSLFEDAAKSGIVSSSASSFSSSSSSVSPSSSSSSSACTRCRELEIEVAKLQASEAPEMSELRGAYDSLLAQMSKADKHKEQSTPQELQKIITELREENEALHQDLGWVIDKPAVAAKMVGATIRRVAELGQAASNDETLAALQAEVLRLQETSRNDLATIDEFRTKLQETENAKAAEIEELQKELRSLRQSIASDPNKDSTERAAVLELQQALEEAKQREAELKKQFESLTERSRKNNNKITRLMCERKDTALIEEEFRTCKTTLTELQSKNLALQRKMTELASQANSEHEKAASMEGHTNWTVLEKLEGDFGHKLPLRNMPRIKLLEGNLKRVSSQKKLLEYHFFLFTDILIYASTLKTPTQYKYNAHRVLHLGLCRLVDIQPRPDSEAGTLYSHSFRLITPQKSEDKENAGFYISCDTAQEKQRWMEHIIEQIEKVYAHPEEPSSWVQVPRVADVSAPERAPELLDNPFEGALTTPRASISLLNDEDLMRSRESSLDFADQPIGDFPTEICTVGLTWDHDDPNRPRAPSNESTASRSRAGSVSRSRANSISSTFSQYSELNLPTSDTEVLRAKVAANHYCRLCVRPFTALALSARQKTKCGCCGDDNVCRACCSHKAMPPRSLDGKEVKVCVACYGGIKGIVGRGLPRLSVEYD